MKILRHQLSEKKELILVDQLFCLFALIFVDMLRKTFFRNVYYMIMYFFSLSF